MRRLKMVMTAAQRVFTYFVRGRCPDCDGPTLPTAVHEAECPWLK